MSGGQIFESSEVSGKLPDELIVFSDDVVFRLGDDEYNFHKGVKFVLKLPVFGKQKIKRSRNLPLFLDQPAYCFITLGYSAMVKLWALLVSSSITFMSVTFPSLSLKIISMKLPLGALENSSV